MWKFIWTCSTETKFTKTWTKTRGIVSKFCQELHQKWKIRWSFSRKNKNTLNGDKALWKIWCPLCKYWKDEKLKHHIYAKFTKQRYMKLNKTKFSKDTVVTYSIPVYNRGVYCSMSFDLFPPPYFCFDFLPHLFFWITY